MVRDLATAVIPFALSAAISAVAGALGGGYYVRSRAERPPSVQIQVVDMRRIVETIARDPALDETGRRARTQEISDVISRFVADRSQQGVIILDGAAVLRAPPELYIEPGAAP